MSEHNADDERLDTYAYLDRAYDLLRQMPSRDGGSLRLLAFQVQDVMRELIALIDG